MSMSGTFQIIDWQETVQQTFHEGNKQSEAVVKQHYSGDIEGESVARYQLFYLPDGKALFTGFEVIEGLINGKEDTLVIKHDGVFEQGVASSHFEIIQVKGNDSFLKQKGRFKSNESGKANFTIG